MPIHLPQTGTLEQKRAVFKFLAQSQYPSQITEVVAGPVRTREGIGGRFRDENGVLVYCSLIKNDETWTADYQTIDLAEELDTADSFTERLRNEVGALTDGWVEQIRELLDNSNDLADFRESIAELYPDLSIEDMSAIMGEALTAARLAGQYEAENG